MSEINIDLIKEDFLYEVFFFTEQAKNTALTKLLGIQQGAGFT